MALSLVVVAVTISVVRYSLPYMNEQKHHVEAWLSEQVGAEIQIGTISAKWQGAGPAIVLENLRLAEYEQSPIQLSIAETAIEVDFWQSVLAKQIQANKFDLRNLQLTLDLPSLQQGSSDYPIVDALEHLFLQQLQLFSISDSKIVLNTAHNQQVVLVDQVSWVNKDEHHQGVGQLQIEEIASNSSSFIIDLYGGKEALTGTFYAKGEEVDLSPWVEQWMTAPHELLESRGSFVMWAAIDGKNIHSVQLDLSNSRFKWDTPSGDIQASVLGGQIRANPLNQEWLFNLDNLTLQINDQVMVTNWRGLVGNQTLSLHHQQDINLTPLLGLLPLVLDQGQLEQLNQLQPTAVLSSFDIQHSLTDGLVMNANAKDIGWQQSGLLPGLQELVAEFKWYQDQGTLSVKSKSGILSIDNILPNDIAYQRLHMDFHLQQQTDNWVLSSQNGLFKSELISLNPNFVYRSEDQHFSFHSKVNSVDIALLPMLYPTELMGTETRAYLVESLQSGNIVDASLLWHGRFDAFPFVEEQGVFQARVAITDGQFKFAPEWPALTQLDLNLLFENQGLFMVSQGGRLMDVELVEMSAVIPELAEQAVLTIDAKAKSRGIDVTELMLQSNLADTLGQTLEQVQISGPIKTDLNLHIPLTGKDVIAKGNVQLADNQVSIPNLNLMLSDVKGIASFQNDDVNFSGLKGQLLGQPVEVAFTGQQQEQGYQANIKLNGNWQAEPLLDVFYPNLQPYLSGQAEWLADVDLTILSQGYVYSAEITSDLAQVMSTLPAPFAKPAEQIAVLTATSQGNQQASSINIKLGDEIEFNGNLPHQDMQFSRAHLAIGETDLVGMGLGFSVSASLPEVDSEQWYAVINSLVSGLPETDKPLLSAPKRIYVNADTAIVASQRLTDLDLVAKNTSDSWLLDINAKEARMEVALYKDWLSQGVNINADFIQLAQWKNSESEQSDTPNITFIPDLDTLPPINFSCARCRYLDHDLGKVDFALSRASTGMRIDHFRLKNEHGLFNGEGDWFLTQDESSTRLKGEFTSSDFGAFLKGFSFNSGIKDSEAASSFDLSWQRAPYEFNFDSLNGKIDWHLSDGYLTEVTDKGSRIFSLLSLESLVRKLTLDFRDVFAKGFFYDKIDGSFQLQNGVADTQDIIVDGGAGEIAMRGYTDLVAQELNYRIEFAPKVTSSLPVIVAWMVNPATALAALAIDQVLTSAKVISNIKFSLTGTLDDPQLKELGRDSKEITLPARAKPEPQGEPDIHPVDSTLVEPVSIQIPVEGAVNG